jgi:Ca-activated chloride channel family protein
MRRAVGSHADPRTWIRIAFFAAVVAVTPFLVAAAIDRPEPPDAASHNRLVAASGPVDPSSIGTGALLWKTGDGLVPLPVLDTEVELAVTGILVHGTVTQRFQNATDDVIEAVYRFPLPEDAAVHRMEMRIGPRRIRSVIQEREEARRTYTRARSEGRKAALVEQDRPNLFTTSAANIEPGETIDVVLEYVDEVSWRDGEFGLRVPLTFTPRYLPREPAVAPVPTSTPGRVDPAPAADVFAVGPDFHLPRAKLRVRIDAGLELRDAGSHSHAIESFLDGRVWEITTTEESVPADRDFELWWRPLVEDRPEAALFVEQRADGRYGLLMLVPPRTGQAALGLPTETVFVVDISGSMAGPSIRQAREALLAALTRLRPEDAFAILAFDDGIDTFSPGFVDVSPEKLAQARRFVRGLEADGGTEIYPALSEAIALTSRSDSERVQRIVFVTDGAVANEEALFERIHAGLGRARLHTIGIGHAPNGYLMRRMATFGRGVCEFLSIGTDTDNRIAAFLERVDRPLMTDVALGWEGLAPEETYPARIPDLYPGLPLVVSFKLGDASHAAVPGAGVHAAAFSPGGTGVACAGRVTLAGRLRDGVIRAGMELPEASTVSRGVAVRWARGKVRALMDSLNEGADAAMVRREVVAVGLAFDLVTRYTSLVAVEDIVSTAGDPASLRVPSALPAGSELGVLPVGGTLRPLLRLVGLSIALAGLLVWCVGSRGRAA